MRNIYYFSSFLLLLFSSLLLSSCATQTDKQNLISIAGSTTVLPLVTRAAEEYRKLHPELRITVNAGGSGVGARSSAGKLADIGMISRPLTQAEIQAFAGGPQEHILAFDGVSVAVSAQVYTDGVRSLSREQIRDIYTGKIRNWKDVGGPDREILCIDKEAHRGTRHVFMKYIFGMSNAPAPGARIITGSNNEEQIKIAQSNSAIGMLSPAWLNEQVRGLDLNTGEGMLAPSVENIKNGRYPIRRALKLVVRQDASLRVRKFIAYLKGPGGQKLARESGYVSAH